MSRTVRICAIVAGAGLGLALFLTVAAYLSLPYLPPAVLSFDLPAGAAFSNETAVVTAKVTRVSWPRVLVTLTGSAAGCAFGGDVTAALRPFGNPRLQVRAGVALPGSAMHADAVLEASSPSCWKASLAVPPCVLTERDAPVARLLALLVPELAKDLSLTATVSADLRAEQTAETPLPSWTARSRLACDEIRLRAPEGDRLARGIVATGGASGLGGHCDVEPVFLRVRSAAVGDLVVTNVQAVARMTERGFLVNEATAGFCGGTVSLYSLFLDAERLNAGATLFLDDIDTGEALRLLRGFSGTASGRLHGKLPFRLRRGRELRIGKAFLYSTPGSVGSLRMTDPAPVTENLALGGVAVEIRENVARALRNLDYRVLRLDLSSESGSSNVLAVQLEGTASAGGTTVPVSLTLTFRGDLEQLLNTGLRATQRTNEP